MADMDAPFIWFSLLFLSAFVALFVGSALASIRRGIFITLGASWRREERPVLFWFGVGTWLTVAAGGLVMVLVALLLLAT